MAAAHSGRDIVADVSRTAHDCPATRTTWSSTLPLRSGHCSSSPMTPIFCQCRPSGDALVIEPIAFAAQVDAMGRHACRRRR